MNKLPKVKEQMVCHLLAEGMSQRAVSRGTGVSRTTVAKIRERNEALITELAHDYLQESIEPLREINRIQLNLAAEIYILIASTPTKIHWHRLQSIGRKLKKLGISASQVLNLADKREYRLLRFIIGAHTNASNIFIKRLNQIQDNSQTIIDPQVAELLADKCDLGLEAEYEVVDGGGEDSETGLE